jgi:hypothetical protein
LRRLLKIRFQQVPAVALSREIHLYQGSVGIISNLFFQ